MISRHTGCALALILSGAALANVPDAAVDLDASLPVPADGGPALDAGPGGRDAGPLPASDAGRPVDGGTAGGTPPAVVATPQEVTISWTSAQPTTTELAFGPTSQPSAAAYPGHSAAAGSALGPRHSHTLRSLAAGTWYYRTVSTSAGVATESPESTFVVPPRDATMPLDSLAPDGPVLAVVQQGTTVYVGGRFSQVGRVLGSGLPTDADGGLAQAGFPMVAGTVQAIAPDGAGGLYLAGAFSRVGGLPRHNAAHLLQDLGVDPAWAPDVDGPVFAIAATGGSVYLGGQFTKVNGALRSNAAAVDQATGAVALPWDPQPDAAVRALVADGTGVVLGGAFTAVQGAPRGLVARVNPTTGAPASWAASLSGTTPVVLALALGPGGPGGTTLYVGGAFNTVSAPFGPALLRQNLVALDAQTGAPVTSFDVEPNGPVNALAVDQARLYLGGLFTALGSSAGTVVLRTYLAAVDLVQSTVLPTWSPTLDGPVTALGLARATVLVGGGFTTVGGLPRRHAAALDGSGTPTTWSPQLNDLALAFGVPDAAGPVVYVGGSFDQAGAGTPRLSAAAFDLAAATGPVLLPWDPQVAGEVNALLPDGNVVYLGGLFTGVRSVDHPNLAAVTADSGLLVATFTTTAGDRVTSLAKLGTRLLFGGNFHGLPFDYLGGVEPSTGAPLVNLPSPNLPVSALAAVGQQLYLGGAFTTVAGVARSHAALVDFGTTATGPVLLPWSPAFGGAVTSLGASPGAIYAGGGFLAQGGLTAYGAAVDPVSGAPVPGWSHQFDGWVQAVFVAGPLAYFGGAFTAVDGTPAPRAAAFGTGPGAPRVWAPAFEGRAEVVVHGLSTDCVSGTAAFGGQFYGAQQLLTGPLAFFRAGCSGLVAPAVTTSPAEQVSATSATLVAEVAPNDPRGAAVWLRYDTADPGRCDDTFGTRAPASGFLAAPGSSAATTVRQPVGGLAPGTTYYFCALAKNSAAAGAGGLVAFTTPPASADGGLPGAPRITSSPSTSAQCGVAWAMAPAADGDPVLAWSTPTAPGGLTVDAATGALHWTPLPAQRGKAAVVLRVQNQQGSAEQAFTVEVSCPGEVKLGTGCQCSSAGDLLGVLSALGLLALRRRAVRAGRR